jgi:hypothetical protein
MIRRHRFNGCFFLRNVGAGVVNDNIDDGSTDDTMNDAVVMEGISFDLV